MSKTLQNSIDFARPILQGRPLAISTYSNEPALTIANLIQQTVMGPPFAWRWNRKEATFNTVIAQQDYTQNVSDLGFPEKFTVAGASDVKEATINNCLAVASTQTTDKARPTEFSVQAEVYGNAATATFRADRAPDAVYVVTCVYQKKPPSFTALSDAWAIPDEYQYIYQAGFLGYNLFLADDPRFPQWNQKFLGALLSAQRGLSEMQRNIFLGNWLAMTQQVRAEAMKTDQGQKAREL